MANFKPAKLQKFNPEPMADLLPAFIKSNGLYEGLYRQCVFEAWDTASQAGAYTSNRFLRDGILYITLSSSVVRSQLMFQRDIILAKINSVLSENDILARCGEIKPVINLILH